MGGWSTMTLLVVAILGYHFWNRVTGRLGPDWGDLAFRFPDRPIRAHTVLRFRSATLGPMVYGNCLRFEISDDYLRISGIGPFFYGVGDPIVIPLARLSFQPATAGLALTKQVQVRLEGVPALRMKIPKAAADQVIQAGRREATSES